jgi:hypothetical protein
MILLVRCNMGSDNVYSDETKSEQVTAVIIQAVVISYGQITETSNPLLRNSAESLATFCDLVNRGPIENHRAPVVRSRR